MRQPQHDDDDDDDEFDSTSDFDADSLFDCSDDEADTANDTNSESPLKGMDNNTDDNDDELFDGEVRHPPKYYIAVLANLDVGRLRQKQYSYKTQSCLDWVKDYYNQLSQI